MTQRYDPKFLRLSFWLERCDQAATPMVPAREIATIRAGLLLKAVDGRLAKPDEMAVRSVSERMEAALQNGGMLRYDCCAGEELKHQAAIGSIGKLASGVGPPKAWSRFMPDDPRLIDCVMECYDPDEEIKIYWRPWVQAVIVDNYPVEFRVFVRHGEVIGVSSYYPQRPLPEEYRDVAQAAWNSTQLLADKDESFTLDWLLMQPGVYWAAEANFIASPGLGLVVLEGGPPHMRDGGAHPCCFKPMEIEGIALVDREPVE